MVKHIKQKLLTAIALAILFLSLNLLLTGTSWAIAPIDSEVVPVIERVEDKQVAEQAQTIQAAHKIGQPASSTQSKTSKNENKEDIARIGQFIHGLKAKLDIEKIAQTVFQQISQNKWGWGILGVLVYVVLLLPLFWLKPLWLLQINEWVNRHSPFTTVNQKIGDTEVVTILRENERQTLEARRQGANKGLGFLTIKRALSPNTPPQKDSTVTGSEG